MPPTAARSSAPRSKPRKVARSTPRTSPADPLAAQLAARCEPLAALALEASRCARRADKSARSAGAILAALAADPDTADAAFSTAVRVSFAADEAARAAAEITCHARLAAAVYLRRARRDDSVQAEGLRHLTDLVAQARLVEDAAADALTDIRRI